MHQAESNQFVGEQESKLIKDLEAEMDHTKTGGKAGSTTTSGSAADQVRPVTPVTVCAL